MKNNYFENYIKEKSTYNKKFDIIKNEALSNYTLKENKKVSQTFLKILSQACISLTVLLVAILIIIEDNRYQVNSIHIYEESQNNEVAILHNTLYIKVGETVHLKAKADMRLTNLKWSVNNDDYLFVNEEGELTALKLAPYQTLYLSIEGINSKGELIDRIIYVKVD